jgi:hypothetical protein
MSQHFSTDLLAIRWIIGGNCQSASGFNCARQLFDERLLEKTIFRVFVFRPRIWKIDIDTIDRRKW